MYEEEYNDDGNDWTSYLEKRKQAENSSVSEEEEDIVHEPKRVKVTPPSALKQLYTKPVSFAVPATKVAPSATTVQPTKKTNISVPNGSIMPTPIQAKKAFLKQAESTQQPPTVGLVDAARAHNYAEVDRLLEEGADPDEVVCGFTALHYCAFYGNEKISALLLDNGATVDSKNLSDLTPLMWAIERGHLGVIQLLIKHGAQVNAPNTKGVTPLLLAIKLNNLPIVEQLTQAKANVNYAPQIDDQNSALLDAAFYGNPDIVSLLLDCGADINSVNAKRRTALIRAASKDQEAVVKLLIHRGANLNLKDCNGRSALHWATTLGFVRIVKILLEEGANYNLADNNGDTPVDLANAKQRKKLIKLFPGQGSESQPDAVAITPTESESLPDEHDSRLQAPLPVPISIPAISEEPAPKEKDVWKAILSGQGTASKRKRRGH